MWSWPEKILRDLLHLAPSPPGRGALAVRAGLAVGVPLLLLVAAGRLEWGLYAVFGAFTAVYGGAAAYPGRWRHQTFVATLLVVASVSGAVVGLSDERGWWAVGAAALWGVLAAHLSDEQRWVPPGPLFLVFAVGGCAARPTSPSDVVAALGVAGGAALWAIAMGAAEERYARLERTPEHGRSSFPIKPERRRMHLIRVAVVVVAAGSLATLSGIGHPYWAMIAAVAPISVPRLRAQAARGVQRAVGTLLGVVVAGALLLLELPALAIVLTAIGLQIATELTVTRNYALAMLFITPLALLMGYAAHPQPVLGLVGARFFETVLGVTIGLLAAWVTRERQTPPQVA